MDKLNEVVMVAFLLLSVSVNGDGDGDGDGGADDETSKIPTTNIIDAARRLFSVPTVSNSWFWFLPPNLE